MIRMPKMGALQFVAVKPLVAVISIIVYACGQLHNWYYQWTLFVIYNISYSVALYALYLIYWSSHEQEALQSKRPLLKFVSVKMIVFLTFWQALLLPLAPLPGSTSKWEDFILSIEMIIFGILMNLAFSWREFSLAQGTMTSQRGPTDLIDLDGSKDKGNLPSTAATSPERKEGSTDASPSSEPGRNSVVQNAKTAFCPRDIMMDASNNFSSRYKQHVLIESAQDYELEAPQGATSTSGITVDLLDTDTTSKSSLSLKHLRPAALKLGKTRRESDDCGEVAEVAGKIEPRPNSDGVKVGATDEESGVSNPAKVETT